MVRELQRGTIRRQYRLWRAAVDLTQEQVEAQARKLYPEFGAGRFWKIENGRDYPTPSERKALAKVLKVRELDLPAAQSPEAKAS